jgi:dCMP deaminase
MILTKRKNRIHWALELAQVAASMSEDPYKKVGAVAIRPDNSIAAVSYNGTPPSIEIDWSDRDERRQYVIHAEMNLMRFIKPHECNKVALTLSPCVDCLKNLVAYGIQDVYFLEKYQNSDYNLVDKIARMYKIRLNHIQDYECNISTN